MRQIRETSDRVQSTPLVGDLVAQRGVVQLDVFGVANGRSARAVDTAAAFGHSPCADPTVQFEEDPKVAVANLVVEGGEGFIQRVVTKGRRGGLVA
jgi:hypothetical protein